jgi:hypothetical protein
MRPDKLTSAGSTVVYEDEGGWVGGIVLWRRLAAEFAGSALLAGVVVG